MKLQGRNLTLRMHGDDVRELQRDLAWIGQYTHLPELRFEIFSDELRSRLFGESTQAAVIKIQSLNGHGSAPDGVVDQETVDHINGRLLNLSRFVRGYVRNSDGSPVVGAHIRVFDQRLRNEGFLGQQRITDQNGYYENRYIRIFHAPNIIVKAFKNPTDTEPIAVSEVKFEADPDVVINVTVGEQEYRGVSDFERVLNDVNGKISFPQDQPIKISELTEDDQHQDITYLSRQTPHTTDRLVHLVLSHRHAEKSALEPAAFYAFQRRGLPTEASALLSQDPGTLRHALVKAAKDNVIPERFGTDDAINSTLAGLQNWRNDIALEDPPDENKLTLGKLVKRIVNEEHLQQQFMVALAQHEGQFKDFWDKLEQGASFPELKTHAPALKSGVLLANIGRNHLPLVDAVRNAGLTDLNKLVTLNEEGWLAIIKQGVGTPDGDEAPEALQEYARSIAAAVEKTEPTLFFAARLKETEAPGKDDLLKFLEHSDFDIKTSRPEPFLETHPDVASNLQNKDVAVKNLRGLQRLYHLQPSAKSALAIQQTGKDSAQSISRMGQTDFVATYAQHFSSTTEAKAVYARARQVSAMATALIGDVNPAMGRVELQSVPDTVANTAPGIPNWSTLFESLDFCSCGHCQSVYSPSAYLVDVLHFLSDRKAKPSAPDPNVVTPSVKTILFDRRPDLGEIELTCENTNTTLPFVDLVLEILEDAVAPPPTFTEFALDSIRIIDLDHSFVSEEIRAAFSGQLMDPVSIRVKRPGEWWVLDDLSFSYTIRKQADGTLKVKPRSRQTIGTTAERRANPQYRNDLAYDELRKAVYPWNLPFDRNIEEATILLKHLGVSRRDLIEALRPDAPAEFDPNSQQQIILAAETLGLTDTERRIIVINDPLDPQPEFHDFWHNATVEDLRTVSVLLDRSGLSYEELEALLDVRLIDPGDTLKITLKPGDDLDPCDTQNLHIEFLDANVLNRMHRFVRLVRKLQWTIPELGHAVQALFGTAIDLTNELLVRLSFVAAIRSALQITVSQTLALLGIGPEPPAREVREAAFARYLRISAGDLRIALELLPEPFNTSAPHDTLRFVKLVRAVQGSGFTFAELHYLLRHKFNPASSYVPAELSLTGMLKDIRDGLLKIETTETETLAAQVVERVAAAVSLPADVTNKILNAVSHGNESSVATLLALRNISEVSRANAAAQFETLEQLLKVATILETLNLPPSLLEWLFRKNAWLSDAADQTNSDLEFDDWSSLIQLQQIRRDLDLKDAAIEAIIQAIEAVAVRADTPARKEFVTTLEQWLGWQTETIEALIGKSDDVSKTGLLEAVVPAGYNLPLLLKLQRAMNLLNRLGVSANTASAWCNASVTASDARAIRDAAGVKYQDETWLSTSIPFQNALRDKQREALVSYLATRTVIAAPTGDRTANASDLSARFLIDVEMSSCMMTSRIKQAISSVQLFVQRCLMNLESEVVTTSENEDDAWGWWKWMKNYRVWEANTKVFLYPENWIEPELRDDKSAFFKELESELMEGDLTTESAEKAFQHYLEKLDQVARLDVMSVCRQKDDERDILHVFARSQTPPHVYYYRQRVNSAYWTPWEKMELDIEGDHLIPVVWNNRLFLFWAIFLEKSGAAGVNNPSAGGDSLLTPIVKYWEVKLAWSERRQGRWKSKKMSSRAARINCLHGLAPTRDFFFTPSIQGDTLTIDQVFVRFRPNPTLPPGTVAMLDGGPVDKPEDLGTTIDTSGAVLGDFSDESPPAPSDLEAVLNRFSFEGCDFDPTIINQPPVAPRQTAMQGTGRLYMFFQERAEGALTLPVRTDLANSAKVLSQTPGQYRVITQGAEPSVAALPFFFQDSSRKYLIVPDPAAFGETANPTEVGMGLFTAQARMLSPAAPHAFNITNVFAGDSHSTSSFILQPNTRYMFHAFYHPYVGTLTSVLHGNGLDQMLSRKVQLEPHTFMTGNGNAQFSFLTTYKPEPNLVGQPYPTEEIDFSASGPYAIYNWELFFHAPLLIADGLSKNQRFEEAAKWFHYIFNPTDVSGLSAPARYWQMKVFFEKTPETYQQDRLRNLLELLARATELREKPNLTPQEQEDLRRLNDLEASIKAWKDAPFKPHLVARTRTTAYQKTVVMKYIDNLIAWGDQLFRRDTLETINEATQLYVLAADILGPRPVEVRQRFAPRVQTYNTLEGHLGELSSALVKLEELIPVDTDTSVNVTDQQPPRMPYFCLPKNDKLLGYWDTVADRLFKIRHCLNIEGVARQLPLFEPPIDPALLVRAAAAGLELNGFPNNVVPGRSNYRFSVLAQKATELCGELRSLGSSLLATLEKRDAEELSLMRAKHETGLLELIEQVKEQQVEEAGAAIVVLQKSRDLAVARYLHYQRLLGVENPQVPPVDQAIPEISSSGLTKTAITNGVRHIPHEASEMESLDSAADYKEHSSLASFIAAFLAPIPEVNFQPLGIGGTKAVYRISTMASVHFAKRADERSHGAGRSGRNAQLVMREHDWILQNNLAAREITQIDKQMIAAEIRSEIARVELRNHQRQMDNALEVEEFMRTKYTTEELYSWMVGQMSGVYFQAYQLAYEMSKRAELCYQHELGIRDSNFIRFGYWDSLRKGLLAGEKLSHDLKRMEVAYLDANKREHELTKHVSLVALAPEKFLELKETGACEFKIPEWLFDMETPGHYMRRLKMVSLTVPCVTGPYTGIHCKLQLGKNSYRQNADLLQNGDPATRYLRLDDAEPDTRFFDNQGGVERIVTSTAQNDAGLFEANFRDERYLPFEGAGAESDWRLELPGPFRTFDYSTISDVILHLRYTARDAEGGEFAGAATQSVSTLLGESGDQRFQRLFSLRHEFPSEWHRFVTSTNKEITVDLANTRFPYFAHGRQIDLVATAFQRSGGDTPPKFGIGEGTTLPPLADSAWVGENPGLAKGNSSAAGTPGSWTFVTDSDPKLVEDVFIVTQFTFD